MREILFRGKTENGNWYIGSLCKSTFEKPISTNVVYKIQEFNQGFADEDEFEPTYISGFDEEVIPETVGQYCLTDKNGQKIFEGDIVKIYLYEPKGLANYEIGCIKYDDTKARFVFCTEEGSYGIDNSNMFEVIGNIHDNPELLGGKEE